MTYEFIQNLFAIRTKYLHQIEGYDVKTARAKIRMDEAQEIQMKKKCDREGHRIVDMGYGGPEGGCVDLQCKRCGWSSKTILY